MQYHRIIPNLLPITHSDIIFQLSLRAEVPIHLFANENRLQSRKAEHDAPGQKAVDDCKAQLD